MKSGKVKKIEDRSPEGRYEYLIQTVADYEEVWLVKNKEKKIQSVPDEYGIKSILIWPEEKFAKQSLTEEWKGCAVESMDLYDFIGLLNKLEEEHIKVAIFPSHELEYLVVNAATLRDDLEEGCSQYE